MLILLSLKGIGLILLLYIAVKVEREREREREREKEEKFFHVSICRRQRQIERVDFMRRRNKLIKHRSKGYRFFVVRWVNDQIITERERERERERDRKSTRLNSRHVKISYAVFCG